MRDGKHDEAESDEAANGTVAFGHGRVAAEEGHYGRHAACELAKQRWHNPKSDADCD